MEKTHQLKTWPVAFDAVWLGDKVHEFRQDDRDFNVNDRLNLREWDPVFKQYTGRHVDAVVTWLSRGPDWGVPPGYVCMSIRVLACHNR